MKKDKHRAKIEVVLTELGIPLQDPIAEFWLGIAGEDNPDGLSRRAHRSALDAPRPADQAFLDLVDRFELVLDAVLERFETRYFEVFERLDALLTAAVPTKEHAKSFRNNFPGSFVVSSYFFSRATAAWVVPLKAQGFFTSPPPPVLDEDGGTFQLPPWPESQYLARVAAEAPEVIVGVVIAMPSTENSRVNHDLVNVARACPSEAGARLVPRIVEAIGSRFGVLIPQEAGALMAALCRGNCTNQAVALGQALLDRTPIRHGPSSSVDAYEYGMILRDHIPSLVSAAGMRALVMLNRALAKVIRNHSERHRMTPGRDLSTIWRPNLESDANRAESDVRHALINAIRDAAASLADAHPDNTREIVMELEAHDWTIFKRMALWLLARYPGRDPELTTARLTDSVLIKDRHIEREYLALANAGVGCLEAGDVLKILRITDSGPQPVANATVDQTTAGSADPESRERTIRWQRDRLAALRAVLPPDWDARYQALVAEVGYAPDPFAAPTEPVAVWSEEESPVSASDLAAMPTVALIDFLRAWNAPAAGLGTPSRASIRGALSSAVQVDAERRSADLELFIGMPAIYIGAVINGLFQAATSKASLDWNGIARLCAWINQQAYEESDADGVVRDWRNPRLDMLRLLMVGLNQEPNPVPGETNALIWSIIVDSCTDLDPDNRREANVSEENPGGGFVSLAFNSVRPQAIRAAISYGLRFRRSYPEFGISAVLELLDQHLNRENASRSVRSIYGELFPSLVWMAPQWATRRVESIFPSDVDQRELLDVAWDAYLRGGRITYEAWDLLVDRYRTMVDCLEGDDEDRVEESRDALIGGHLIRMFWHGHLTLDSHDGLLRRYYNRVSPKVAEHLMWSVGQSIDPTTAPDPQVIARLRMFWEFRVSVVKHGADSRELVKFGYWFASGHFDAAWSFAQLLTALSLAGDMEREDAVLARAAELAPQHLQPCLAVVARWVSLDQQSWRLTQGMNSIRAIVRLGLAGSPAAVETSTKVVSVLARDHGIDLRDLLRDSQLSDS